MANPQPRWEVVEDASAEETKADHVSLLTLALKTFSQRAIAAVTDLFTLVTIFGAWWLWYQVPDPTPNQIISNSIFAVFIVVCNWLVRR